MCGVVAIFDPKRDVARFGVQHFLKTLAHRGPDGSGVWYSADGHCALAHRRLSMVDLANGQQPLVSANQAFACVINGELYDPDSALRSELQANDLPFRTRSDSELLLQGFVDRGPKIFSQLRGEFAAIVYDAQTQTLHAARDPFGIKPLVYGTIDGALVVASEAKMLFALGHPAKWDRGAVQFAMQWQYLLPDQTLFEGIRLLPGGEQLTAQVGSQDTVASARSKTPWEAHFRALLQPRLAQSSHEDLLVELLRESVQVRMHAEVPMGAYLSGGVDSSAVSLLASRCTQSSLPVFTLGFTEHNSTTKLADGDESMLAQQFANQHQLAWTNVISTPLELVENTAAAVFASEGLTINGHLAAKWKLSQVTRAQGVKGVLVGEGADELFLGYPHLLMDWLSAEGMSTESVLAKFSPESSVMLSSERADDLLPLAVRWGAVPSWLGPKYLRGKSQQFLLHESVRFSDASSALAALVHGIEAHTSLAADSHPVENAARSWSALALSSYILKTLGDGTEMAHGVEGRVPFLDPMLAVFAQSLSVRERFKDNVEKGMLRSALASLVGPEVAYRTKRPLVTPFAARDAKAHEAMQYHLRDWYGRPSWVDPAALDQWLDGVRRIAGKDRVKHDPTLFMLLSAGALERSFNLKCDW